MLWSCPLAYSNGKKSLPSGNHVILWKTSLNVWFSFCALVLSPSVLHKGSGTPGTRQACHRKGPLMNPFEAVGARILIWVFKHLSKWHEEIFGSIALLGQSKEVGVSFLELLCLISSPLFLPSKDQSNPFLFLLALLTVISDHSRGAHLTWCSLHIIQHFASSHVVVCAQSSRTVLNV